MRLPNWQSRFAAVIEQKQRSAFAWGVNDCCLFCCDAIAAMTGIDPGAEFRDRYDSPLSGAKLLRDYCGGGLETLIEQFAQRYAYLEVKPVFAQRGDIGLYRDAAQGDQIGVSVGPSFAFLMERGLLNRAPGEIARAWRIS